MNIYDECNCVNTKSPVCWGQVREIRLLILSITFSLLNGQEGGVWDNFVLYRKLLSNYTASFNLFFPGLYLPIDPI